MKLRKLAALGLTAALTLSLGAPAFGAEAADARLTKVALAVKETLDIGDGYTEFYGEPQESPLGTRWSLSWKNGDEELNVTATGEGKVLSLNRRETGKLEPYYVGGRNDSPAFPAMTRAQAGVYARAFLDKVLSGNEKVTFDDRQEETLSAESYRFNGSVELNGLPSPMTVWVQVRLSDGAVTGFRREDVSDYAGVPGEAKTSTTSAKARELLKSTLSLRLEYVLDWDGKEGSEKRAVLRYLPNSTDEFYVDAATGELVNLTELQKQLREQYAAGGAANKFMASAEAPAEDAADRGLTDVELEGVAKLEGVLDKEALDGKIRAWKELNLGQFTLGSANYTVDRETGEVTARVSYARNTEEGICRRTVTVDAKTGALISMYGYDPIYARQEGVKYLTAQTAREKGAAFLAKLWPEPFGKTEVYEAPGDDAEPTVWSFTFAQKENGYFFPGNAISVRVDAADGSILGFSKGFDEEVAFDDAEGLIPEEAAVDAWCESYPVGLGYLEVPVELDLREEFLPLRNAGYRYYNALKPGYALGDRDAWYSGVDAKTGKLAEEKSYEPEAMFYDDVEGHWAKDILDELARYNVGWRGGKAQPDQALTQKDYIILLASANGYSYDPRTEENVDSLYAFAYRQGVLAKDERQDDKALTRSEMVKMLLDGEGYGKVAQLPGIFRCDFADAASIPQADLGYAALAQGLGLIAGDSQGNYAPQRPAQRCEAAALLWQFLKR